MKDFLSPTELSKIFDISVRAVTKRAHIEDWKTKITYGRGKNGKRYSYCLQSMTPEDRKKIIAHELGCNSDFVSSSNPDFSLAEAGLKKWSKTTDFNRKIAQAREIVLNKLCEFVKINNLSQGIGEERFASFYNANLIKEIPPIVFDKISTLSAPTLRRWKSLKDNEGLPGLL